MRISKCIVLVHVFVGLCSFSLRGQSPCFEGEIIWLYTQTELDSLMQTVPECTVFEGNLILLYDETDPIADLSPLHNIESFPEQLAIQGQQNLKDLVGLERVKHIGSFWFHDNTSLMSFRGLDNLEEISSRFVIKRHNNIVDLSGFESLKIAGNQVDISFNDNLLSLNGLDRLEIVSTRFYVGNNPRLSSISGLNSLAHVGEEVYIVANEAVSMLSGFQNLRSSESLIINGNRSLQTISGFSSLEDIDNVRISNNEQLVEITGLGNVIVTGVSRFDVWNNESLGSCNNTSICRLLKDASHVVYIDNNASGCMSPDEVASQCAVTTTELHVKNRPKVYPNPSAGFATLAFGSARSGSVIIRDISGAIVSHQQFTDQISLSLRLAGQGLYLVQIAYADGTAETYKHIVTR